MNQRAILKKPNASESPNWFILSHRLTMCNDWRSASSTAFFCQRALAAQIIHLLRLNWQLIAAILSLTYSQGVLEDFRQPVFPRLVLTDLMKVSACFENDLSSYCTCLRKQVPLLLNKTPCFEFTNLVIILNSLKGLVMGTHSIQAPRRLHLIPHSWFRVQCKVWWNQKSEQMTQ